MRRLTENDVYEYTHGICFKTGPPGRVGAELEFLVVDRDRPHAAVPLDLLTDLITDAGPPPAGSAVTLEPGGQLELSSPALPGPAAAYQALTADLDHLEPRLDAAGLDLVGTGLDPNRDPRRQLSLPRYAAMESYFDTGSPAGRTMMCSTASVQVCLDIGADTADVDARWELTHRLRPVLIAAFANSPLWRGRPTGWRSARQLVWAGIDATRTRPAARRDPAGSWAGYALDANVMAIRREDRPWLVNPGLRFRDWLAGDQYPPPDLDDLVFHLSTLFPPVRPRGWLELRMIDTPPRAWWPVPLAVAAALLDDPEAQKTACEATSRLHTGVDPDRLWLRAARDALTDPDIAACARACFAAARAALPRIGATELVPLVAGYQERYVDRGRCPADDQLDQHANGPDRHAHETD